MIPIVSDLLTQPGVMVGMGLGICVGFFARASIFGDSSDPSANLEDEDDDSWDEDGFLAEGTGETKLVLVVRSDLKMGKGKAAAQVVLKIDDEESMLDLASLAREVGLTVSLIQDAGRTQIAPGSRTVLGVGPGPVDLVDQITGHLKLF
ncbi:peptidyl-tRNA hydrolase 2, mitochondrial-like isoform X2 [Macrobrachium nipponense]|uniref:peptidyl-tRNA hydrolase 2, mitochondrial-like isoform X2 n=1 Tax=Macrobrachium nipponense TaxID=159736 RepID=UPI0030C7EA38